MDKQKFEQWALLELFGHQRLAGRVTEETIGGQSFVRVDVPECPAHDDKPATQAFTKLFGPGAIYSISFMDEAAARIFVRQLRVQPIEVWQLRRAMQDLPALGLDNAPRQPSLVDDEPLY